MWWCEPPLLYFPEQGEQRVQQMFARWKRHGRSQFSAGGQFTEDCLKGTVWSNLIVVSGISGLNHVKSWGHGLLPIGTLLPPQPCSNQNYGTRERLVISPTGVGQTNWGGLHIDISINQQLPRVCLSRMSNLKLGKQSVGTPSKRKK